MRQAIRNGWKTTLYTLILLGPSFLHAGTWTNSTTSEDLNDPNNWSPAVVPTVCDFDNTATPPFAPTHSNGGIRPVTDFNINSGTYTYTVSAGSTLNFNMGGNGVANNTVLLQTFNVSGNSFIKFNGASPCSADFTSSGLVRYNLNNGAIQFNNTSDGGSNTGGAQVNLANTSNLTLNGVAQIVHLGSLADTDATNNIQLNSNTLRVGSNNTTTTVSSPIDDNAMGGSLVKNGAAKLTLTGTNTYSGGTTIVAGTLQGNTNSLPSAGGIVDDASLVFDQNTPGTYSGNISGMGSLNKIGTDILTLSGNNTYLGTTSIQSGTISIGASTNIGTGTISFTGASGALSTLEFTAPLGLPNAIAIDNNFTALMQPDTGTVTLSGPITGMGTLAVAAGGTLALTNVGNTYSGGTEINQGVLTISSPLNIGDVTGGPISFTPGTTSSTSSTLRITATSTYGTNFSIGIDSGFTGIINTNNLVTATFNGDVTDINPSGSLTKLGLGTLVLTSNTLTYSGTTIISNGTLEFDGDTSGLTGNILDNASLVFNQTSNSSVSGDISGSGTLTQDGSAKLTLTGTNSYMGTTTVNSGTLQGNTNSLPSNIVDNGNVIFNQTTSGTYTKNLSGGGQFTKIGAGLLTLSGLNNTFTGTTVITNGTLAIGSATNIGTGQITFNGAPSSTLEFTGAVTLANAIGINAGSTAIVQVDGAGNTSSLNGNISGAAGTLVLGGGGTLVLGGANTIGTIDISQGTLSISSPTNVSGAAINFTPTTYSSTTSSLLISATANIPNTIQIDSGFTANMNVPTGATGTLSGSVTDISPSGNLTKTGGGVLILSNNTLTYSGTTTINSGTLQFNGNTSGLLGNIVDNSSLVFQQSANSSYSGNISGSGSLSKNSTNTLIFSGVNTYSGTTNINNGVLQAGSTTAFSPNSPFNVNALGTLNLNDFSNTLLSLSSSGSVTLGSLSSTTLTVGSGNFSGVISGAGGLTKQGIGTLTLSNVNTYTGLTNIAGGILALSGAGAISPTGQVEMQPGATFDISAVAPPTSTVTIGDLFGGDATSTIDLGSHMLAVGQNSAMVFVFGGVMQGAGGLIKQNSDTLVLTGPNSYTGGTTITGGTLRGNTTSIPGNVNVGFGTTLNFDQTINGTYASQLSGSGTVLKTGGGVLNYTGNSPLFTGTTSITQGKFALNGFLGGNAIVSNTGIISGTGTLGGNLTINAAGTIAPGNSIGTLTVNGNYIQNGGTTYSVQIDGLGHSSLINVVGTATLNGGQVVATSIDGSFLINYKYTIVTSSGGVMGTFAGVTATNISGNPALITPMLSYDPNHAYLSFQTTAANAGNTPNEIAVGQQIDLIQNPTPSQLQILNALINLSPEAARLALSQMSGEQHTADLQISELINRQFIRRLYDPIRSIITTSPCDCPDSFWPFSDFCFNDLDLHCETWLAGSGGHTKVRGNGNAHGFKSTGYEITLGIQKTWYQAWTFGLAGSYEVDDVRYNIGGSGKMRTWLGGIYGLYRPAGYYVLTDLAYGYSQDTLRRHIQIGTLSFDARSKPKMSQLTFYAEAGIDWQWNCFLIQPFIGLEVDSYTRHRLSESGAGDLNLFIGKKDRNNTQSRLGTHLTYDALPGEFDLSIDLAWQHRFATSKNALIEHFATFGTNFTVEGVPLGKDGFEWDITLSKDFCSNWNVFAEVYGEVWSRTSNHNLLGGIRASW